VQDDHDYGTNLAVFHFGSSFKAGTLSQPPLNGFWQIILTRLKAWHSTSQPRTSRTPLARFLQSKKLAERAMEQVTDEQLFDPLDQETNSIAVIVKHLSGNMRSRWTDFLTTDGEKPDRNRDGEFLDPPPARQALLETWEDRWARLFNALESLSEADR
jgi:Protein of unknown function (DUF1572)